jgi:hypothetical protein
MTDLVKTIQTHSLSDVTLWISVDYMNGLLKQYKRTHRILLHYGLSLII